jgi:hypothetical protein
LRIISSIRGIVYLPEPAAAFLCTDFFVNR